MCGLLMIGCGWCVLCVLLVDCCFVLVYVVSYCVLECSCVCLIVLVCLFDCLFGVRCVLFDVCCVLGAV